MPYTNVDYFDEKGPSDFQQKHHSRLFLLSLNSKLSHFDKNVNLNHKCLTNLAKIDMIFPNIIIIHTIFYINTVRRKLMLYFLFTCLFCFAVLRRTRRLKQHRNTKYFLLHLYGMANCVPCEIKKKIFFSF
jgi:hypothetical protein